MRGSFSPEQWQALEEFCALADLLIGKKVPVDAQNWAQAKKAYQELASLQMAVYCPVRRRAYALDLEPALSLNVFG